MEKTSDNFEWLIEPIARAWCLNNVLLWMWIAIMNSEYQNVIPGCCQSYRPSHLSGWPWSILTISSFHMIFILLRHVSPPNWIQWKLYCTAPPIVQVVYFF